MERIPAKAQIQHQLGGGAVIVLNKHAAEGTAPLGMLTATLNKAIDDAEQEIGAGIAAVASAAEAEIAVLPESVDQVHLHLHEISADRDLMAAADPVKTVADVIVLPVEGAGMSGADAEVAGHRNH